jgi:hypothetical protein
MHVLAMTVLLAAISPSSGDKLCQALIPGDFAKAGIRVDKTPRTHVEDDNASAYCTYKGKSGAMGGVELDVFYPADDAAGVERTALGEAQGQYADARVANVDDSRIDLKAVSGGPPFATLVVRKKNLVYVITIPTSPHAEAQLRALSSIVLQRLMP